MEPRYITYPLSAVLMVILPVALGIFLTHRFKIGWRLWWIGAATFVLSQVGHIPFNMFMTVLFQRGLLPSPPPAYVLQFNALILGLSAGLWEELSRYAAYRWWARDARTWRKGILMGAGHGGIESIILGVLALTTFIFLYYYQNANLSALPIEQQAPIQQALSQYWSLPLPVTLLGAIERSFALMIQISLSVLVLQVFTRKQISWLWLAIGWHTLVDATAVYASAKISPYLIEGLVGIFALLSLGIIFALRQPEPPLPLEEYSPLPDISTTLNVKPVEETGENLEKTRYN